MISATTISPLNRRIVDGGAPPFSFGNALQFDGVNDYVSFTAINNGDVNHTHSFWIKLISTPSGFNIAFLRSNSSFSSYIGLNGATVIRYRVNAVADFTVPTMTTNVWYHVVITYVSDSGARLYFNGVESTTGLISGLQNYELDEIGRYASGAINGSKIMDEIATWNTALSATDIANLYNSGNGDFATNYSPANLQAYWRMNESGTATTAVNSGSGGATYDGTLTNFPTSGMWVAH